MRNDFAFTLDELTEMRAAQTDHMLDECVIQAYAAGTQNDLGELDAPTYTDTGPFWCGLDMTNGNETKNADYTVINWDATLRLGIGTPIKETDRVKIVARFGMADEFQTYEVVSPIERGPSGLIVKLRKHVE